MAKKNKNPKCRKEPTGREIRTGSSPGGKEIRIKSDPGNFDKTKIAWQISTFDIDGEWGWTKIGPKRWLNDVVPKLQDFESMTWAEIQKASGGRKSGNNSHFVLVENLKKEARDRLVELQQDDIDELFSLRLQGKHRIYGIRDGRVLRIIWFDPHHEIYPTNR